MHVVVVEDAPELVMLFRILLEREGMRVTTVSSGFEQATETLDWSDVDVAVVDRFLGSGFEGTSILQWLSAERPEIRRVMITADWDTTRELVSADSVLQKPVDKATLLAGVRGENG